MLSDPKRLQVIDRIVDVLESIQEGDNFFYSPRLVCKGFQQELSGYPAYMVVSESGGEIETHSDMQFEETFYVAVQGVVQSATDVVTPLERAVRDVRKAINDDFKSGGASGSLIGLAVNVTFDAPPDIDYGFEANGFFGYFSQRIRITIFGEFGEL